MAGSVVYINVDEGAKRVMNNTKLYIKLLIKFKEDQSISQIDSALSGKDMEAARNAAHTLKGLAANLSLIELYNQVAELEKQIKSGSADNAQAALVKSVYDQTIIEVDKVIAQNA